MTATVILHIGINETGERDVQHWLYRHREALLARGILYPRTGLQGESHARLAQATRPSVIDPITEKPDIDVSALLAIRDALREEITASRATTVVVSSEAFAWLPDLAPVQDLFRHFETRVVVALRRHDHWWEAAWRRHMARQCENPDVIPPQAPGFAGYSAALWEAFPEYANFLRLLDRWGAAFGEGTLSVYPCAEPLSGADSIEGFRHAAGLSDRTAGLTVEPLPPLPLLPRRTLQKLDAWLRVQAPPALRRRLIAHTLEAPEPEDAAPVLPPGLRSQMIKRNLPSYEQITRRFLQREKPLLFTEAWPDPARENWQPPAEFTATEAASEVIALLAREDDAPLAPPRSGFLARLLAED